MISKHNGYALLVAVATGFQIDDNAETHWEIGITLSDLFFQILPCVSLGGGLGGVPIFT